HLSWRPKLIPLYQKQITYAAQILPLSQIFFKQIPPLPQQQQQLINPQTSYYPKLSNPKLPSIKSTDLPKQLINYNQTAITLNQLAQIQP
ncbi:hypothetical protein, partial [Staphylococcus aureus]|uniref:hypothetical protein n=1 Tax=Staphylococcus aureus TaxID=1280 RepID=UPI001C92C388